MKKRITPATFTCGEAAKRHRGFDPRRIQRMCLHGQFLLGRYGSIARVPRDESREALFAEKIGREWVIPVEELDRVFLRPEKQRLC